jgi:hypothetical protein
MLSYGTHYNTPPVTKEVIEETQLKIERFKQRKFSRRGRIPQLERYFPSGSSLTMQFQGNASIFVPRVHWTGSKAILTNVGVGVRSGEASPETTLNLEYAQSMINSNELRFGGGGGFGGSYYYSKARKKSEVNWPAEERTFTIEPGKVNRWNIVLPEPLIKGIRLSLQLAEMEKNANTVTEPRLPVEAKKDN